MESMADQPAGEMTGDHPAWCTRQHAPRAPHALEIGTEPTEHQALVVGLSHWGRDVVTIDFRMSPVDADGTEFPDLMTEFQILSLTGDAARRLARRLVQAADILDGATPVVPAEYPIGQPVDENGRRASSNIESPDQIRARWIAEGRTFTTREIGDEFARQVQAAQAERESNQYELDPQTHRDISHQRTEGNER